MARQRDSIFWFAVTPIGVLVVGVLFAIGLVVHDITTMREAKANAAFHTGQMVRMRAFGNEGMVVRVQCHYVCYYDVRFSALQLRTDTHIFGADGPVEFAPVSIVRGVREYELEAL